MVAISFSGLLDGVMSGRKQHTIRRYNQKRTEQMARLGLQMFWKQRTPQCRKLFDSRFVLGQLIEFDKNWWPYWAGMVYPEIFRIEGRYWPPPRKMTKDEANTLAVKDGFRNVEEMQARFREMYGKAHEGTWIGITFTPPPVVKHGQ